MIIRPRVLLFFWFYVLTLAMLLQVRPSQAADNGKPSKSTGTAFPAQSEKKPSIVQPGRQSERKSLPPDLEVSDISLDGKCRVVLGVRNKGKGPVSDEAFRRGQIRVEVVAERRKELIPFTTADPKGMLKAPGGVVRVVSGLVLERKTKDNPPQQVNVEVDSTGQIEESDEDNLDTKRFQPSCWAAEVKGIEGLGGGGKEEGLGGAKGFEKKDGDAGRMGVKSPASGGISVPGGKINRDEEGCPVAVEEVVASGSEVVVILGREGVPQIGMSEAAKLQLKVLAGTRHGLWTLAQVDPGLRHLNGGGGQVKFATGLELEKSGPVMARLLGCETKGLTRMLTPEKEEPGSSPGLGRRFGKPREGEPEASGSEGLTTMGGMVRADQQADPVKPAGAMMAGVTRPEPDKPSSVPQRFDRGILILNPAGDGGYYAGETIPIFFRPTRDDLVSGTIQFNALNETGVSAGSATVPAVSRDPVNLALRADAPPGRYAIMASHTESDAFGSSDPFEIHFNSARIDFLSPERGSTVYRGERLMVRYQTNRRVAPGTVTFQLGHAGAIVSTQSHEYAPGSPISNVTHTLHWDIPADAPEGEYAILATHPNASGLSPVFSVQPRTFGDAGPGTPTAWEIRLVTPGHMPVSWPRGSTHTIAWRIDGAYPAERRFLVQLMRGSETVLTIPSEGAAWHGASQSYSLDWAIPADLSPASDYRIRVQDRNGPTEGSSERDFAISGPIEALYTSGAHYIGNPMQIRWRLAPGSAVRRVRATLLAVPSGAEVLDIGTAAATAGEIGWVAGANTPHGVETHGWEYRQDRGPSINGSYKVRIADADDAANFGEGGVLRIEPPDLRVWVRDSHCRNGKRIHWESSNLSDSARVEVAAIWRWANCIYGGSVAGNPLPMAVNSQYFIISPSAHPSGNFCWQFRDTNSSFRCTCFPGLDAYAVVSVRGFRYVTMASTLYSPSGRFEMSDSGCDNSDPPWEGIWD